jgi:hypothetical protein
MIHDETQAGSGGSAVAWASIAAGVAAAAGVSLILLALGSGLGFASMSPWPDRGMSAGSITAIAAVWLIVTQWISSGLGGYIAGRLRTRWIGTHHHEIFFRDTAHGLVTWALSTVLVTVWAATALTSLLGGGVRAATQAAAPAGQAAISLPSDVEGYDIDRLFRASAASERALHAAEERAEVAHILANFMIDGALPDTDRQYLAGMVAARTGLDVSAAQKRVDDLVADAGQTRTKIQAKADVARKAAAESSIYLSLALLIGAFIASVSAALGGRMRDQHV